MNPLILAAAFLSGALGAVIIILAGGKLGLTDYPGERSSHNLPTPKGGGAGIVISFIAVSMVCGLSARFWVPAALISLIGLMGDVTDVSAKSRLILQLTVVSVFCYGLNEGQPNILSLLFFWSLFITGTANFYNFMDGINGIAAVSAIIGFFLLAVSNFSENGPGVFTWVSSAISMACLGFLPFNMPSGRVFMGDLASLFLGFVFAATVMVLSESVTDFICLAGFLFPFYADELSTMMIRIRDRESLFAPHRRHLYQVLANERGVRAWKISTAYGAVQLIIGLGLMALKPFGIWALLSCLAAFSLIFIRISSLVRRPVEV